MERTINIKSVSRGEIESGTGGGENGKRATKEGRKWCTYRNIMFACDLRSVEACDGQVVVGWCPLDNWN